MLMIDEMHLEAALCDAIRRLHHRAAEYVFATCDKNQC